MTSIAENILFTRLCDKIEDKKESMIELTQDLIKIPTLNPPGENYREICEYLDTRLSRAGFSTELIAINKIESKKLTINDFLIKDFLFKK